MPFIFFNFTLQVKVEVTWNLLEYSNLLLRATKWSDGVSYKIITIIADDQRYLWIFQDEETRFYCRNQIGKKKSLAEMKSIT